MKTPIIVTVLFLMLTATTHAQEAFQSEKLEKTWELKGFEDPSCVVFDSKNDVFYVANKGKIAGLNKLDEDGYITIVTKDGTIKNNFWIKGLISPLDMVIHDKYLYVADMAWIDIVNIEEGKLLFKVPIQGARYLNCITADKNGIVYISDMLTKKIYVYQSMKATELMDAGDMGYVTAFAADEDRILCAGKENIYLLDPLSKYAKSYIKKATNVSGLDIIDDELSLYSVIKGTLFMVNGKKQEILLNKPGTEFERFVYVKENSNIVLTHPGTNSIMSYTLKP